MEKENSQSKIKRKILIIVLSMILCLALISISVYAALSQTLTAPGTIIISTDGQAKTAITVSYAEGALDNTLFGDIEDQFATVSGLSYTQKATKAEDANTADGTASNIVFGIGSYTYVAYKVEFTNSNASAVNYTIDFKDSSSTGDYNFNSQITIYSGTTSISEGETAFSGTIEESGTATVYIVIAVNNALEDLTAQALENFNLVVSVTAAS